MTLVAAQEDSPIPSLLVADDPKPARSVRVADDPWFPFGDVVGDRRKAQWLAEFMRAVVDEPAVWLEAHAAAKIRGESFAQALTWGIRQYRNRGEQR
jgi:hypothetical protein